MAGEPIFEQIKKVNKIGQEYWSARELFATLEYIKWDKFLNVIEKAKEKKGKVVINSLCKYTHWASISLTHCCYENQQQKSATQNKACFQAFKETKDFTD